jgi:acetyl-CoA C-acetyltransferase
MAKVPQKLDTTRAGYYKNAPIAKFGERKAPTTGMGRKIKNTAKNFREVVCVEACRTPYGVFGGALRGFDGPQLGALAIKECLRRTGGKVKPEDVDYVIMGQASRRAAGSSEPQATILAGLPESVPSITLNKVCSRGSSPSIWRPR